MLFALPFFLGAVVVLTKAQIGIHQIRDEKQAYKPIAYVVRGFILLRLAEICVHKPLWIPAAVVFYSLFE